MTEPLITEQPTLEPVHAGEDEVRQERWPARLVLFLRVMAGVSLLKGLYHLSLIHI